jgi:molybdopterin converting factor subunit 1
MEIRLLFFAQLRDLAKTAETEITLDTNSTIDDLLKLLPRWYPDLKDHLNVVSFAVDNEYVSKDTLLQPGCTVALIPPISGG